MLLSELPNQQKFGVVEMEAGRVVRLTEKPKVPQSNLALICVYIFQSYIFKEISSIEPYESREHEITDVIQWLMDKGYRVVGEWPDDLLCKPAV